MQELACGILIVLYALAWVSLIGYIAFTITTDRG